MTVRHPATPVALRSGDVSDPTLAWRTGALAAGCTLGVAIAGDSRRTFVSDVAGVPDVPALGRTGVSLARHDALFIHGPGGSPATAAVATAFSPRGLAMVPGDRYLLAAECGGVTVRRCSTRPDSTHRTPGRRRGSPGA